MDTKSGLIVIDTYHTSTYIYIHIHTYMYNTCSYIHMHTHIHPLQTGSYGFLQRGQLPLETPWRVAAPQDQLGWGLRRNLRMHTAQGGRIGGTRNSLWAPPTRAARAGAPKRVLEWVPDGEEKWGTLCWHTCLSGPIHTMHTNTN